jgi:hypothetical protein
MPQSCKILYLDLKIDYINPTRNLLADVFKQLGEVSFFGPGYVDQAVLAQGLTEFARQHGPFDFAVANEHTIFAALRPGPAMARSYQRNYVRHFPLRDIGCAPAMYAEFLKLKTRKIVTLLESDFYNFSRAQLDIVKQAADYLLTFGEQFVRPVSELEFLARESFSRHAHDTWYDYLCSRRGTVLSVPAFLSTSEFDESSLAGRAYNWAIPGSQYWARREAKAALAGAGITSAGANLSRAVYIMERLKLRPYGRKFLQRKISALFNQSISAARYAYTCGSGLGYPVRKYFEIPAKGTVLVCLPCNGFEALGFADKENALKCLPQDIPAVNEFLENNPEKAQAIASAGREMVRQKHSVPVRAGQIKQALYAISQDRFNGSRWDKGNFIVEELPK